ncbi:alpha-hydroxy-acid oxidizing protein [Mesorhizobium sp. M7A.F.Ca.US.007.01.1.1]|nr:alpha-hydroxy-acid oxidizing protein [Mesorhizobium sp. M7A.F.Ca.US.007.01.1.1]
MTRLDTGITLFGQSLPHPIILAPIAYLRLVHPEAR